MNYLTELVLPKTPKSLIIKQTRSPLIKPEGSGKMMEGLRGEARQSHCRQRRLAQLSKLIENEREKLNLYVSLYNLSSPELMRRTEKLSGLISEYTRIKEDPPNNEAGKAQAFVGVPLRAVPEYSRYPITE